MRLAGRLLALFSRLQRSELLRVSLGCDAVPQLGAFDAAALRDEDRVETQLLLRFVVLQGGNTRLRQQDDDDDVEPGHGTDGGGAEVPDDVDRAHRTDEGGGDDGDAGQDDAVLVAGAAGVLLEQVGNAGVGVEGVGQDRGEGEEEQGDGNEGAAEAGQDGVDGFLREVRLFDAREELRDESTRIGRVGDVEGVGGEDHDRRGRADEERVYVNREGLHETLLGGVRDFGRAGGLRARALTGFVREDAALDTPLDRQTEDGAVGGVLVEGAAEDQLEDFNDLAGVGEEDDEGEDDVGDRHEGDDHFGRFGDPASAAEDDVGDQHGVDEAGDPGVEIQGVRCGLAEGVGLDAGQREAATEDGEDGEGDAERAALQAFFHVVGGATTVFTMHLLFPDLREGRFDVGGAGAEEGDGPHPEDGAGAAEEDGGGDAGDVAGADAATERHGEALERGDARGGGFAAEQLIDHVLDQPDLRELHPQREINPGQQAAVDHDLAPEEIVCRR